MNNLNRVTEKPFEFEFNRNVTIAWDLTVKTKWSFLGFLALSWLISVVISLLGSALSNTHFAVNIAYSLITTLFSTVLMSGVFLFLQKGIEQNSQFEFAYFFGGFKKAIPLAMSQVVIWLILSPLFVLLLLTVVSPEDVITLMNSPLEAQRIFSNVDWLRVLIVGGIVGLGMIFVGMTYCLTVPIIVNNEVGFWEAMELSRKLVWQNFFSILAYFIVLTLISFFAGGLVALLLGVIMIVPFLGWLIGFAGFVLLASFLATYFYAATFGIYYQAFESVIGKDMLGEQVASFGEGEVDLNTESQENQQEDPFA